MESYKATTELLEEKKKSLATIEAEYERVKAAVSKLRAAQVPPRALPQTNKQTNTPTNLPTY